MENNKDISRKNWILIWIVGMAGQICWNVENSWFNTFVYAKIAPDPSIIAWMVGVSAAAATFATFLIGTWSDRIGKRKPFIGIGYILWGLFTIAFGAAQFLPKSPMFMVTVFIVATDAIMSFFGSMGNDAGFSIWTTDISNPQNRGKLGGALATMPVFATIFGAVVSGIIIDAIDFFPFFIIMGAVVMATGILSFFTLKDSPSLKPRRDEKGYWHQFISVFQVKTFIQNKELFWVLMVMGVYFIGFNVYFPYITIYFVNYLGFDYTTTGAIQGVGLIIASLFTIPAAKFIDRGKSPLVILVAVLVNFMGLFVVTLSNKLLVILIGVLGVGIGYILTLQTLTAWSKNLYPETQRGQFEGIKQIFLVAIPMLIGPWIATFIIKKYGVDGVPNESLFWFSAIINCFTLLPLMPAYKLHKARLQSVENN